MRLILNANDSAQFRAQLRAAFFLAILFGGLSAARDAAAQTSYTWNRTANSSWKNNPNWLPNSGNQSYPHLVGDGATFNLNTVTAATVPALNASVIVGSVTVNSAPSSTNFGLTINSGTPAGSTLTFQATSGNATYTENADANDGTGKVTINAPIQLNSNLDVVQSHNVGTNSTTEFTALLSAASSITLTKSGLGNLQLDAAPTAPSTGFQGTANINAGGIRIADNVFANSGNVTVASGGQLEIAQPAIGSVTQFNLGGSSALTLSGAGKSESTVNASGALRFDSQSVSAFFNSPVVLNALSTVFIDANLSPPTGPVTYGQLTLPQSVSGNGALTVDGPGILVLAASNSYAAAGGGTTVNEGSHLLVTNASGSATGAGSVLVDGTLGGSGHISGPVTFGGGALWPSFGTGVPTILSLGTTTFADPSTSINYLLGASSDLTHVTGNLTLNGTLNVSDAGGLAAGVYPLFTYTGQLVDNGLVVGSHPDGFAFQLITSAPGAVSLAVVGVPEPATLVMATIGLGALLLSGRRRVARLIHSRTV